MSSILLSDNPTLPVLLQRVKDALLGEAKGCLLDIALGEEDDLDIEPPEDCNLRD